MNIKKQNINNFFAFAILFAIFLQIISTTSTHSHKNEEISQVANCLYLSKYTNIDKYTKNHSHFSENHIECDLCKFSSSFTKYFYQDKNNISLNSNLTNYLIYRKNLNIRDYNNIIKTRGPPNYVWNFL